MSPPKPESPVAEGDIIAEKYRVERVLGFGGMGVVVAAMHVDLDERVALKFLLPEGANNPLVAARFAQEARAAVKIKSEHVARVIDVGKLADGLPYMVMEYMHGEDLEKVLAARGALPIEETVGYALQAIEAIAEAHSLGIVHRDLKPANLFLAQRPSGPPIVKVLDFGISKSMGATHAQLTQTSSLVGSPLYMSPEQMNASRSVDTRADIWAIGIVLYELLSGRVPFEGESMPELVGAVLMGTPRTLASLRPDVPEPLNAIVMRCLEKAREQRFADVGELARALVPFGPAGGALSVTRVEHLLTPGAATERASSPQGVASATVGPVESTPRVAPGSLGQTFDGSDASSRAREVSARSRGAWLAAAGVLLAGTAMAAMVYSRPKTSAIVLPSAPSAQASPPAGDSQEALVAAPPSTGAPPASPAPPDGTAEGPQASKAAAPSVHRAHPVSAGAAPAPSVSAAAPKVDCDPPYSIDAQGHRKYKAECIQ